MNKNSFFNLFCMIFLIAFIFSRLGADVYVKSVYHYEERYHHGSLQPAYNLPYEWWIGKDKVTFSSQEYRNYEDYVIEPALRITLDKENRRVVVVNASDGTYVIVPLSINIHEAVGPDVLPTLKEIRIEGSFQKLAEKPTVNGIRCECHLVKEALFLGKSIFYERERKAFVARELPFDWRLSEELLHWIRSLFNPNMQYVSGMSGLNGFIYAANDQRISRNQQLLSRLETVEIIAKNAPGDIYDIPSAFRKIPQLTREYLSALRRMIYQAGG